MKNDLTLALAQVELAWENPAANREQLSERLKGTQADVILLPEMFTTGFTMAPEKVAEAPGGATPAWMKELAQRHSALVIGSYVAVENGQYFNRLLAVTPEGIAGQYDKRHLFRMGNEHLHYAAGQQNITVAWQGWNIRPLVCYDLRFPVWSRNRTDAQGNADYDLLVYVANWPARRSQHWRTLLLARAIENQSYVAGLNRVGNDGKEVYHSGDSAIVDFAGNVLASAAHAQAVITQSISRSKLTEYRNNFPAWRDADSFEVKP